MNIYYGIILIIVAQLARYWYYLGEIFVILYAPLAYEIMFNLKKDMRIKSILIC